MIALCCNKIKTTVTVSIVKLCAVFRLSLTISEIAIYRCVVVPLWLRDNTQCLDCHLVPWTVSVQLQCLVVMWLWMMMTSFSFKSSQSWVSEFSKPFIILDSLVRKRHHSISTAPLPQLSSYSSINRDPSQEKWIICTGMRPGSPST